MSILKFIRGEKYSRADVKEVAGLSRHAKGGPWDTGVAEHNGELLIFANVKTVGRTGHDYPNIWEGNHLRWYHKNGSTLGWPSVKKMLGEGRVVHVFWRNEDRAQFEYAGVGTLIDHKDTSPVEVLWSFNDATSNEDFFQGPDEITPVEYREGATRQVTVNAYERDPTARQACIARYGSSCIVCGFSFQERYGEKGAGYIHVHHLKPLSQLGMDYRVNPTEDLRPLCPNCHAMAHRRRPHPYTIDELKAMLTGR